MFKLFSGERSYGDVDHFHPTFIQHQKVYEFSLKYCKGKNVLDLGCGSGYGSLLLSRRSFYTLGVDYSKSVIAFSQKTHHRQNLYFSLLDLNNPKLSGKFEVVVSLQVIEHIKDVNVYLTFIKSILRQNGLVILSTPNTTTQGYNENPYHIHEYSAKDFKKLLKCYFNKIDIYGLYGDKLINDFEKQRKERVMKLLTKDTLHIRYFIPICIKRWLFTLLSLLIRIPIVNSKILSISTDNFTIKSSTEGCLDLLAVCSQPI